MTTTTAATWSVGDKLDERTSAPLTRTDFVKYQGASGDFHPLHHDETYALANGFPSVFSVGMLQAGMLATYVTDTFGVDSIRRFQLRFVEQVWPGDELTFSAEIVDIAEESDGVRLRLATLCMRQNGRPALKGEAEFLLPSASREA